jgi:hypothetical protein
MAAADPSDGHAPGESVAAACRDAGLVRLVATSDGDALAATGVLARAFSAAGIPFQASVRPFPGDALESGTDADATVTVGAAGGDVALDGHPASPAAYAAAREIAADAADPTLALAGVLAAELRCGSVLAAGAAPGDDPTTLVEDARAAGCERRPGVGVPTADLADGLAHTTFVHTPDSGDTAAYREALAEHDLPGERTPETSDDAGRRLASLLAFDAVRSGEAPPRAADAVERALRPHTGGPFATVEGYADVLEATARRAPGTGVALALGHDARDAALDAWRDHASAAHRAVRAADTSRYDGCVAVVTRTGPVETVARLVRDFRSPEPAVLVVGDGEAAAAGDGVDVGGALRATAAAAGGEPAGRASSDGSDGGTSHARGEGAYARLDTSDPAGLIDAFREGLA